MTTPTLLLPVVLASLLGTDDPICFPLPADWRVRFDVTDGSGIGVAESLACLDGRTAVREKPARDGPVTLVSAGPVPLPLALADASRALARVGIRLRPARHVLRIGPAPGRRTKAPPAPAPAGVRVVLLGDEKVALVTSRPVALPSRAILDDPAAVTRLEDDHYVLSRDLRRLVLEDPMAFVGEGAALPNLLGFPSPGFLVTWIRAGGVLDRMGLRTGDTVTTLNGLPLTTIGEAFFAYNALQTADVLVVTVVRGFGRRAVVYEFR
jgi:hypothetical protein